MKNFQLINGIFSTFTALRQTIVVELNNALDYTDTMEYSLLCTNKARENGVEINDVPIKYNESSRFDVNFAEEGIYVLLQMNEPISYIAMRYPMDEELNECRHVELTIYKEWNIFNDEMNI